MADYNIYIHANGSGGGGNATSKTTPWSNQEGSGGGGGDESSVFQTAQNVLSKGEGFATSGFSGVVNQGISKLSKAYPWVGLVVAAGVVVDKVLTTGFQHVETYTGDYRYACGYNDLKAVVNAGLNPVGAYLNHEHRRKEFNKQNKKIEQEQTLVGNSMFNTSKRGV